MLSSVLVHPGFTDALDHPTAAQKGLITAIYYLGTWFSYIFLSHPLADALGRRYAALAGTVIVAVGTAFEAGASAPSAYALFTTGRIISGMGIAVLSTSVPLYQRYVSLEVCESHSWPGLNAMQRGCAGGATWTLCSSQPCWLCSRPGCRILVSVLYLACLLHHSSQIQGRIRRHVLGE